MANSRKEMFNFYRSVIRITKNWKAKNESDTGTEINFIKNTARQMAKELKTIENNGEKTKRLMEMNKWLQISQHYGIPYERPYHLPTGSMRKSMRPKL
ncbi:hypothetical protein BLA29_006370 [Euroglyphus maynei]|uniref:LYR motif-containing protein 1-like protein n=1 Tax=Euroglyphus maynei TaxID=6958 RepID=A0A1Y3AQT7_EURMA|nr:hypothetical protein BLA29_006370 [Euroglyphus maynei]